MKLISIASLLLVVVATVLVDAERDAEFQTGDGGVKWRSNCDFVGGVDFGNIRVLSGEQCGRACLNNGRCDLFVYKDGVCYLKHHILKISPWLIHTSCGSCDVCGYISVRQHFWVVNCLTNIILCTLAQFECTIAHAHLSHADVDKFGKYTKTHFTFLLLRLWTEHSDESS